MKRIDLIKPGGFTPNENLVVTTVDVPIPSNNEVLVDVKASAINPVDWKMAEYGFLLPDPLPAALGCDVAGIVEAGPKEWIGKRVVAYLGASKVKWGTTRGAYVDKVLADMVFEIPDKLSYAQAASLPVGGMTAIMLLDALNISENGWVLVWGASSSVGFHAIQLASKRGWKVIAIASGKHKDVCLKVGATAFVDYRNDDVRAKVKEIVGSASLDGAADCIGSADSFGTSAKLVSMLGSKDVTKVVSSTNPEAFPDIPEGVVSKPVFLGKAMEEESTRTYLKEQFPRVLSVEPQSIRSVSGPLTAETVQTAFQISKDGVSGEKVVIEWTK